MSSRGVPCGPSLGWLPSSFRLPRILSDADIQELKLKFANAASLCQKAGFDAIELHCGHGYLLSQFLTPLINRRRDRYGGSVEGRAAFPREVLEVIKKAAPKLPIIVKMNLEDGLPGLPWGLQLDESIATAKILARAGADGIVPSFGYTSLNGFGMLRGNVPLERLIESIPGTGGAKWILRALGGFLVPQIAYSPLFLREAATKLLAALRADEAARGCEGSCKVLYIGGADSLDGVEVLLADGFDGVQLARPLLREPFYVRRLRRGVRERERRKDTTADAQAGEASDTSVQSKCIRCNYCTLASVATSIKPGCIFLKPGEQDIEELITAARL